MANVIKPQNIKVITQDGEVTLNIKLELDINLNLSELNLQPNKVVNLMKEKEENSVDVPINSIEENAWIPPDFSSNERLKFGKKE